MIPAKKSPIAPNYNLRQIWSLKRKQKFIIIFSDEFIYRIWISKCFVRPIFGFMDKEKEKEVDYADEEHKVAI